MASGQLKGRFRIFQSAICDIFYTFLPQAVGASCALHNLIEAYGKHFVVIPSAADLLDYQQQNIFAPHNALDSLVGSEIRDACLLNFIF